MTPTDNEIKAIAGDVAYIRARLDQHIQASGKDRVELESRLTTLEVRSGLWGLIGGLISGVGIHLSRRT